MSPIVASQDFSHLTGQRRRRPTELLVFRHRRSTGLKDKLSEPPYTPFFPSLRASIFPAANDQRDIAQDATLPGSDAAVTTAIVVLITLAILSATLGLVAMTVTRTKWYKGPFPSFGLLRFRIRTRPRSTYHAKEASEEEFGCIDGVKAQLAFPPSKALEECVDVGYPGSLTIAPGPPLYPGDFRDRMEEEEADIALALKIALRDKPTDETRNDQFSKFEPQPQSYQDNWNRRRQGSDASDSTEQTPSMEGADMFSVGCSSRSSTTSLSHIRNDEEYPDDADEDMSEPVYEVQLARAQSLEVKRGFLMSWKGRKGQQEVPKTEFTTECSMVIPSLMITGPSTMSLATTVESSTSSMDLGEFPLPPRYLYPAVFNRLVAEMRVDIYN